MADNGVYAEFTGDAKISLDQKGVGLGWRDLPEILQTISGLHEEGKLSPVSEEVDDGEKFHFHIGSDELGLIAEEAKEIREKHSGTSDKPMGAMGLALQKALG